MWPGSTKVARQRGLGDVPDAQKVQALQGRGADLIAQHPGWTYRIATETPGDPRLILAHNDAAVTYEVVRYGDLAGASPFQALPPWFPQGAALSPLAPVPASPPQAGQDAMAIALALEEGRVEQNRQAGQRVIPGGWSAEQARRNLRGRAAGHGVQDGVITDPVQYAQWLRGENERIASGGGALGLPDFPQIVKWIKIAGVMAGIALALLVVNTVLPRGD